MHVKKTKKRNIKLLNVRNIIARETVLYSKKNDNESGGYILHIDSIIPYKFTNEEIENSITVILYTFIEKILNANKECNGYGFPFNQPYLILFQRIKSFYFYLQKFHNIE